MNNRGFFDQTIFKNNPRGLFRGLGEQVFNQFLTRSFPTNVYSQKNQCVLEAELPGVKRQDIHLKYERATLAVKVARQVSKQTGSVQLSERLNGELVRRLEFEDINKNQTKAGYEDGVLVVILPKNVTEGDEGTTITVE